jgi:hypothetical protein
MPTDQFTCAFAVAVAKSAPIARAPAAVTLKKRDSLDFKEIPEVQRRSLMGNQRWTRERR